MANGKSQADRLQDIQDEMEAGPTTPGGRNINTDVHSGGFLQRPHAALEDRLASVTRGYASWQDIPKEAGVKFDANTGDPYREVREHTGARRFAADGTAELQYRITRRPVALSLDEAKARRADYWAGTWIRNGLKREAEHPDNVGAGAVVAEEGWETAQPNDAAAMVQEKQAVASGIPIPVVPPSKPAPKGGE